MLKEYRKRNKGLKCMCDAIVTITSPFSPFFGDSASRAGLHSLSAKLLHSFTRQELLMDTKYSWRGIDTLPPKRKRHRLRSHRCLGCMAYAYLVIHHRAAKHMPLIFYKRWIAFACRHNTKLISPQRTKPPARHSTNGIEQKATNTVGWNAPIQRASAVDYHAVYVLCYWHFLLLAGSIRILHSRFSRRAHWPRATIVPTSWYVP